VKSSALKAVVIASIVMWTAAPAAAQTANAAAATKLAAGKDYEPISSPQTVTTVAPGQIEVAEVFMFSCPHCFTFEGHVDEWLARKPDYVKFVRIPAQWNRVAQLHARAFYTAELLGKTEQIAKPFFTEFHTNHNQLDTQAKLAAFFARFGVDETTFNNTFTSFGVDTQLARANDLLQRYGVEGTPAVVVAGKYLTNGTMAGSYGNWFAIIDELAATEHAAAGGGR
jgi:protein dithiol oxidoreductase (disulfide-forming)